MSTAGTPHVELDRAHLQSKVIVSNLEHLGMVLSEAATGLRDDLKSFTRAFGLYVGRLSDACTTADTEARASESRQQAPGPATTDRT